MRPAGFEPATRGLEVRPQPSGTHRQEPSTVRLPGETSRRIRRVSGSVRHRRSSFPGETLAKPRARVGGGHWRTTADNLSSSVSEGVAVPGTQEAAVAGWRGAEGRVRVERPPHGRLAVGAVPAEEVPHRELVPIPLRRGNRRGGCRGGSATPNRWPAARPRRGLRGATPPLVPSDQVDEVVENFDVVSPAHLRAR